MKSKTKAIAGLSPPENKKEWRSVLGCIQRVSRFNKDLSSKTSVLRELMKDNVDWVWTQKHDEAFNLIKSEIRNAPVLTHFNPLLKKRVVCDASGDGIGAVLEQYECDRKWHPVCFASRFLNDLEKNYCISELELLAVV